MGWASRGAARDPLGHADVVSLLLLMFITETSPLNGAASADTSAYRR